MSEQDQIEVEVAFAEPKKQLIVPLLVKPGTTAGEAITLSNIADEFPDYDMDSLNIGIFSKACKREQVLKEYDRVEIYRPLIADPKEVRKRRAAEAKAKKEGATKENNKEAGNN